MNKLLPALLSFPLAVSANHALAVDSMQTQKELWQQQVRQTECRFAASMARRDVAAFESFLADPAVFFSDGGPLEGKAAVMNEWRRYFEGAKAPFSWEPDQVTAVADGSLAHSSGPVFSANGQLIARFSSIWRQEAPGRWRIVIDRGMPVSAAERAKPPVPGKGCEGP